MSTCWEYRAPDGSMLAFLEERPGYCDRGRWHAIVEAPRWKSESDPWPRYYFDLERGKAEVLEYMRAKRIAIEGGEWHCVIYGHPDEMKAFEHLIETGDPGPLAACRTFLGGTVRIQDAQPENA